MNPQEQELIYASEMGDFATVSRLLAENPDLNVACTDMLGRMALHLAVINEHSEIVRLLLDRSEHKHIQKALLHSIQSNHEDISAVILKHPNFRNLNREANRRLGGRDYFFACSTDQSEFPSEITPLILAAKYNRIETVMNLINMGETIQHPHSHVCSCSECFNKIRFDELRFAKLRLLAYEGLCSESYVSMTSKDPILVAFNLSNELRKVAKNETYFRIEYENLIEQLGKYVVKLLDNVRGDEELEVILNQPCFSGDEVEQNGKLDRLKQAIHFKQKKFIAHPVCQKKLQTVWYSDWHALKLCNSRLPNTIIQNIGCIAFVILYPLLCVLYLFVPRSKVGKILQIPYLKFLGHTISYIVFLVLIFSHSFFHTGMQDIERHKLMASVTWKHYIHYRSNVTKVFGLEFPATLSVRESTPSPSLILICIWIVGLLWQECKQVHDQGIAEYMESVYNWLDFLMLTFYVDFLACKFVSVWKVRMSLNYFAVEGNWIKLTQGDTTAMRWFAWLPDDRFLWKQFDPVHVSECFFAVANVFSFSRLSYLLAVDERLGPLQTTLGRMLKDVLKFSCICLLVMTAFCVSFYNLYWYYNPEHLKNSQIVRREYIDVRASDAFSSFRGALRSNYFTIFGTSDGEGPSLGSFDNELTETTGFLLHSIYGWFMVVVLLNMLVAMMTRSYENVVSDQDVEWKFARTRLCMEYIQESSTLPVPFNIVPSPKNIVHQFKVLLSLCVKGKVQDLEMNEPSHYYSGRRVRDSRMHDSRYRKEVRDHLRNSAASAPGVYTVQGKMKAQYIAEDDEQDCNTEEYKTYRRVIQRIVKRYMEHLSTKTSTVRNEEIKQDLSSFRFEVLNYMKSQNKFADEASALITTVQTDQMAVQRKIAAVQKQLCEIKELMTQNDCHMEEKRTTQRWPFYKRKT